MISKKFNSETSKDVVEVVHFIKSHKAIFRLLKFDDLSENVKLISLCIDYLKKNDIKWIIIKELKNNIDFPLNTIWFRNNVTNDINCHIEDFEKFYMNNMKHFIKPEIVHIKAPIKTDEDDGWTKVVNKKKEKTKKMLNVSHEINTIASDWNDLCKKTER
jgi:hypothetical protein